MARIRNAGHGDKSFAQALAQGLAASDHSGRVFGREVASDATDLPASMYAEAACTIGFARDETITALRAAWTAEGAHWIARRRPSRRRDERG